MGVKGGRCVRLTTLPPSCVVVLKSGNLNSLEPSGTVQACNGTALPFLLLVFRITCNITVQFPCRPSELSVPEDIPNYACEVT